MFIRFSEWLRDKDGVYNLFQRTENMQRAQLMQGTQSLHRASESIARFCQLYQQKTQIKQLVIIYLRVTNCEQFYSSYGSISGNAGLGGCPKYFAHSLLYFFVNLISRVRHLIKSHIDSENVVAFAFLLSFLKQTG